LIGFGGMVRDDETGLLQDHARYYDPKNGIFISQDPVQDGMNWYDYVRNSPTNFTDPSGLLKVDVVGVGHGAGVARVKWKFTLDKDATANGYFVQEITTYRFEAPLVNGHRQLDASTLGSLLLSLAVPERHFWESFGVLPNFGGGIKNTTLTTNALGYTDLWQIPVPKNTWGFQIDIASVKFYDQTTTQTLTNDAADPTRNPTWKDPDPASVLAPSSRNAPEFWAKPPVEGTDMRVLVTSWCGEKPSVSMQLKQQGKPSLFYKW